jgi:N-acyl-D-aspartate/D-glutamate deacylase
MSEFFGYNEQLHVESLKKSYDFEVSFAQSEWDYSNPDNRITYSENYSQLSDKLLNSIAENKEFDIEIYLVSYTIFDETDDTEEIDRVNVAVVDNEVVISQAFLDCNKDLPQDLFKVVKN